MDVGGLTLDKLALLNISTTRIFPTYYSKPSEVLQSTLPPIQTAFTMVSGLNIVGTTLSKGNTLT